MTTFHMHRSLAQLLDFLLVFRFLRVLQLFFRLLAQLLTTLELEEIKQSSIKYTSFCFISGGLPSKTNTGLIPSSINLMVFARMPWIWLDII